MNRRDRFAVTVLVVLLAVVGAAMLVPGAAPPHVSPTPTAAPTVTYREAVVGHPSSITPLTALTQADRDLVALVFRGLVRAAPDGALAPDLASSWTVSSDGLTYTFYIRSDARWEDGQPVTAADVAFTVGLAQDPDYQGPLGATWQGIKATALTTNIVRFTLSTPLGGFLRQATLPILPEHVLNGVAVSDLADSDFSVQPMGDGPFRIGEIDDSHALLSRVSSAAPGQSPEAPGSASATASGGADAEASIASATASDDAAVPGNVQTLELVFFDDQASAVASFKAGNVDALGGLAPDAVDDATSRAGSRVVRYPWASLTAVVLNQRASHPEFQSTAVRQALLSAIDRPTILTSILRGRGSLADAPLPNWSAAYDKTAINATPFSSSTAQAGLTAAGWVHDATGWTLPHGTSPYTIRLLTLDEASNPIVYRVAQQVAIDWRAQGLNVTVQPVAAATYSQRLQGADFDAAVVDYRLGLDPDVSSLFLSTQVAPAGSNLTGVQDQGLDRLLANVRTTADPTDRQTAVSALEKYVTSNVLILPICFADYEFVVSHRVQGPSPDEIADPSDRYWDVLDWRLASDG